MRLTKAEIQKAIAFYTEWLEGHVRMSAEEHDEHEKWKGKPLVLPEHTRESYHPQGGHISRLRRDLIELRLMLREVEAEEDRTANKLGLKGTLNIMGKREEFEA